MDMNLFRTKIHKSQKGQKAITKIRCRRLRRALLQLPGRRRRLERRRLASGRLELEHRCLGDLRW